MKDQSFKNVVANADSTMNQTALSNPIIGYHTLKLLDGLRQSYNDASKRINKIRENQRISESTKDKRIKNLEDWQNQLKSEFEFWAGIVKKWVSSFDEDNILYGYVIIEYYCNINNIRKLHYITEDILCEDEDKNKASQNFQAKIRTITLNQIQKQEQ